MKAKRFYLICASHRSGSTFLFDALLRSGQAGKLAHGPMEDFLKQPLERAYASGLDIHGYIEQIQDKRTSENGVCGGKIMWNDFVRLLEELRKGEEPQSQLSDRDLLLQAFPDLAIIQIKRRDKLKQAISYVKMRQRNFSHLVREKKSLVGNILTRRELKTSKPTEEYNAKAITEAMRLLKKEEARWDDCLCKLGCDYVTVIYENLVEAYDATVLRLLAYIVPDLLPAIEVPQSNLLKVADEESETWEKRYLNLS